MVTLVILEHPLNARLPMAVTELGMTVFLQPTTNVLVAVSMMPLQLLRESYFVLPDSTIMFVRLVQPEKAEEPMEVMELGMVTLVNAVQSENAFVRISVTELGMARLLKLLHPRKAPS